MESGRNRIAGCLPDVQTRKLRNSFACINRTMPMLCSRRTDWPTSAMTGGFRPPGALFEAPRELVPHPLHAGCRLRSPQCAQIALGRSEPQGCWVL